MSGYTVRLQCSFLYNGAFATFSFQRTVGLIPRVTRWCGMAGIGSVLKRNFVVLGYDSSHVGHAAVAHFDVYCIFYVADGDVGNEWRPVLEIPFRCWFLHGRYRVD